MCGDAGLLSLNLDEPSWMEEAGIWTFGKPVNHIHVGLFQKSSGSTDQRVDSDDCKVAIAVAHEDNSVTVIKRSLKFLKRNDRLTV